MIPTTSQTDRQCSLDWWVQNHTMPINSFDDDYNLLMLYSENAYSMLFGYVKYSQFFQSSNDIQIWLSFVFDEFTSRLVCLACFVVILSSQFGISFGKIMRLGVNASKSRSCKKCCAPDVLFNAKNNANDENIPRIKNVRGMWLFLADMALLRAFPASVRALERIRRSCETRPKFVIDNCSSFLKILRCYS